MALVFPLMPAMTHAEARVGLTTGANVGGAADATSATSASAALGIDAALDFKPIVVTQQSARAEVVADDETILERTGTSTSPSETVRAHAALVAQNDANVKAIALASDKVSISYRQPAKLFGFITIHVPVHVSVEASGETKVSYPWYRFLMATDQAGIAVRTKAIADRHVSAKVKSDAAFSAQVEMQLIDSLQTMLKSEAEARASAEAK